MKKSCHYANDLVRMCLFEKKLSLFKEVIIISIISFKIGFFWYCEILLFSGIFGLELVEWAMWTVNLQRIWSECVYLKKSCHYLRKL